MDHTSAAPRTELPAKEGRCLCIPPKGHCLALPMPITLVCAILSVAVHGSNPIIDAATYTTLVEKSKNGVLYRIVAPTLRLDVLHVFGSPYERGEAHGRLLSAKILEFVETSLPAFFRSYVGELEPILTSSPSGCKI